MTFIDQYLKGLVKEDDIDDYIDEWHEGDSELYLYEFLGMTWNEYKVWATQPSKLKEIVDCRNSP